MIESRGDAAPNPSTFEVALVLAILVGVALGAYGLFANWDSIAKRMRDANLRPLAIATSPEGATVIFDGKVIGISPVRVMTEAGAHSVTVRLDGYKSESRAISLELDRFEGKLENRKLVRAAAPWITNIPLTRSSDPGAVTKLPHSTERSDAAPTEAATILVTKSDAGVQASLARLEVKQKNLHAMILADPEKAVSLSVAQGRIESLEKEVSSLRQDVKSAIELRLGMMAILISILLALFVPLFRRSKSA